MFLFPRKYRYVAAIKQVLLSSSLSFLPHFNEGHRNKVLIHKERGIKTKEKEKKLVLDNCD